MSSSGYPSGSRTYGHAWRRSPLTWRSGTRTLRKRTLRVTSPLASSSTGACSPIALRLHRYSAAFVRGDETAFAAGHATDSYPSTPIAAYRGFAVTERPASGGTVRLGQRCPERSDALEYATVRTLDLDEVSAYDTGLFQRLEHLLDALAAELKAAQDGLAREETNLESYTEQLARPFEHEQALITAQHELTRMERKLISGAITPRSSSELANKAGA
jgi:hypothetical protein